MAKTSVSTFIARVKRQIDYDITDSDLDNLLVDQINNSLKIMNQQFLDEGIMQEISASGTFQTIGEQEYRDVNKAVIVGDTATFTGIAGDTIDVNIDGTDYADIDISGATDIDDVVTAINTAVGSTVASADNNTYLQITSLTTGSSSTVTIADGTSTVQTVVGDLFSVAANRTDTAISDLDEIIKLTERTNDTDVEIVPYTRLVRLEPNPTESGSTTADFAGRWLDRIYFRDQPSTGGHIYYLDYIKQVAEVASGDTLPFSNKYDPYLEAMVVEWALRWLDSTDAVSIQLAERNTEKLYKKLVVGAAKNPGMVVQVANRDDDTFIGPRPPANYTG
jgi:hypothetical protein